MTRRAPDLRAIARQRAGLQPRQLAAAIELQAPARPQARTTAKASGSRGFYSTARWRRYAKAYLEQHPVCMCEDACGQPSAFVDHRVPIVDPYNLTDLMIWDPANHQALSDRCHRVKSRAELGRAGKLSPVRRTSLRIKGADLQGRPLDPKHPWYRVP